MDNFNKEREDIVTNMGGTGKGRCMSEIPYCVTIEAHFQAQRGSPPTVLCSPEDWRMMEAWERSGIPLEVVLRGIDAAFEKHRARRLRYEQINSLAYCRSHVLCEWAKTTPAASAERGA